MRLGLAGLPADDLAWVVEEMEGRADSLGDCRFLVTGASGFVGRWIVASLIEIRRQLRIPTMTVQVLIRRPASAKARLGSALWTQLDPVFADINDPWSIPCPASHIIHGATPSSVRSGSSDSRRVLLTSVLGTSNLIQAVGSRSNPPRVLHLSSGAVYGAQPHGVDRISEEWLGGPSPFLPTTPYAEGKRAAEALLEDAGRDGVLVPIQARLFAFLGPGLPTSEGFAIGNFMGQAASGETVNVRGDGSTVRSYLDAKEMALWLILLSLNGQTGTPYNVGSPNGRPLRYWAELCASLAGVDVAFGSEAIGDRPAYVPDTTNSCRLEMCSVSEDSEAALVSWMSWIRQTES